MNKERLGTAKNANAEYEIFQRFRALTEGKIALLVSHRFSTVRMADRIAVLKSVADMRTPAPGTCI